MATLKNRSKGLLGSKNPRRKLPPMNLPAASKCCTICRSKEEVLYRPEKKRFYCKEHYPVQEPLFGICEQCGENPADWYFNEITTDAGELKKIRICPSCNAKNQATNCFVCKEKRSYTYTRRIKVLGERQTICIGCLTKDPRFFNGECISCKKPAFLIYKSKKGKDSKADLCRSCYDCNEGRKEQCSVCQKLKRVFTRRDDGSPLCGTCYKNP